MRCASLGSSGLTQNILHPRRVRKSSTRSLANSEGAKCVSFLPRCFLSASTLRLLYLR